MRAVTSSACVPAPKASARGLPALARPLPAHAGGCKWLRAVAPAANRGSFSGCVCECLRVCVPQRPRRTGWRCRGWCSARPHGSLRPQRCAQHARQPPPRLHPGSISLMRRPARAPLGTRAPSRCGGPNRRARSGPGARQPPPAARGAAACSIPRSQPAARLGRPRRVRFAAKAEAQIRTQIESGRNPVQSKAGQLQLPPLFEPRWWNESGRTADSRAVRGARPAGTGPPAAARHARRRARARAAGARETARGRRPNPAPRRRPRCRGPAAPRGAKGAGVDARLAVLSLGLQRPKLLIGNTLIAQMLEDGGRVAARLGSAGWRS